MCESHKAGHESVLFGDVCNFENYPTSETIVAGDQTSSIILE